MKMGLRSPPTPGHNLIELFVKGQTVSGHGNVTGHAVLLAHPAHTQRRGGARIGGVALDGQDTPYHAILAEIVGNTRAHNPPSDNHHLSGLSHAGPSSLLMGELLLLIAMPHTADRVDSDHELRGWNKPETTRLTAHLYSLAVSAHDHRRHRLQQPARHRGDASVVVLLAHELHADGHATDAQQGHGHRRHKQHRTRIVEDGIARRVWHQRLPRYIAGPEGRWPWTGEREHGICQGGQPGVA